MPFRLFSFTHYSMVLLVSLWHVPNGSITDQLHPGPPSLHLPAHPGNFSPAFNPPSLLTNSPWSEGARLLWLELLHRLNCHLTLLWGLCTFVCCTPSYGNSLTLGVWLSLPHFPLSNVAFVNLHIYTLFIRIK